MKRISDLLACLLIICSNHHRRVALIPTAPSMGDSTYRRSGSLWRLCGWVGGWERFYSSPHGTYDVFSAYPTIEGRTFESSWLVADAPRGRSHTKQHARRLLLGSSFAAAPRIINPAELLFLPSHSSKEEEDGASSSPRDRCETQPQERNQPATPLSQSRATR